MDYITAFLVGGVICALVQILLDKTKLLPGRVMVLLVCSGAVLRGQSVYMICFRTLQEPGHQCHCLALAMCCGMA